MPVSNEACTQEPPWNDSGTWHRRGYVGLFTVENVLLTDRGLEFDIVSEIAHLTT
jgi:hypothetical protein